MRSLVAGLAGATLAAATIVAPAAAASANPVSAEALPQECVLAPDTKVTDITYEQLQQYELLNGESIPTLAEFLDFADLAGVGVLPEIKFFKPDPSKPLPPLTQLQLDQLAEYRAMMADKQNIPADQKFIGNFEEQILAYFKSAEPTWPRVWFRANYVGNVDTGSLADQIPPSVAEMEQYAPSANVLGLINVMYYQGNWPLGGSYNVPQEFFDAGIPVNIWYNTLTKGDSPDGAPPYFNILPVPGWNKISALEPKNVDWITTDFTGPYAAWTKEQTEPPAMIAHRGGGIETYNENSMQAFYDAVNNGAAVLETDVQWTKPTEANPTGVPVLMHDQTINRTVRCKPTATRYETITPQRVIDTRQGGGPVSSAAPLMIDVSAAVPPGAKAVAYNLTVTGGTSSGYLALGPTGAPDGSSTINWTARQTIANGYVTQVGSDLKLQAKVGGKGSVQVILDVLGYFMPNDQANGVFMDIQPKRVYDSRMGDGKLQPGQSRTININDEVRALLNGGAPSIAASLNVTVTGTTGAGFVSLAERRTTATSTVNWTARNQTIANAVISNVDSDGSVVITAAPGGTPADVVVDLMGYFSNVKAAPTGADFYPFAPVRSYDSRVPFGQYGPLSGPDGERINIQPIPMGASALAVNTTVTGTTDRGFMTVQAPDQMEAGTTSLLNWSSTITRANGAVLGASGLLTKINGILNNGATLAFVGGPGSTQYLFDVSGYFLPPEAPGAPATLTAQAAGSLAADGISVTFTPPEFDGRSPIDGYEYSTDDGASWEILESYVAGQPTVLPKPSSGASWVAEATYKVTMRAFNAVGAGIPFAPSQSVTLPADPKPPTVPDAPATFTATLPKSGEVLLSFSAPAFDGGAAITKYQYSTNFEEPGVVQPAWLDIPGGTAAGSYTVTVDSAGGAWQKPGEAYYFSVRAVNSVGEGAAYSPAQQLVVLPVP